MNDRLARAQQLYAKQSARFTNSAGQSQATPYRLLKPADPQPGQAYPLVLFLHGAGECGTDNTVQLCHFPEIMSARDHRQQFPCYVVAPQCRSDSQWVDSPWDAVASTPLAAAPTDDLTGAMAALDQVIASETVDTTKIYLTGLSMGGYGVWEMAMRWPNRFAAIAPICGGGDQSSANRLINMPIWAWHGDQDDAVPVQRSRQMIEALQKLGGRPQYTELPGVGHHSWVPAYDSELISWLFEQ